MYMVKTGVFAVLDSDDKPIGAGFLVSLNGLAVTCAHVIQPEERQNFDPVPTFVNVIFADSIQKHRATVLPEYWRPSKPSIVSRTIQEQDAPSTTADKSLIQELSDIAFLQIEGPIPASATPLQLGYSGGTDEHEFKTHGFPKETQGLGAEGTIRSHETWRGLPYLRLDSSIVTHGYSGAPVYDVTRRRVIAMIAAIRPPDASGRMGTVDLAIPAEDLVRLCPDLKPLEICPYRGLGIFTKEFQEFYCGRDKIIQDLCDKLAKTGRYLEVVGPSGSGKSSLVQAGLVPRLEEGTVSNLRKWDAIITRPLEYPFEKLKEFGLSDQNYDFVTAVRGWLENSSTHKRLVLVIDQFEELFTSYSADIQQKFTKALCDLLDAHELPVIVITTIRDDFLSSLSQQAPSLFNRTDRQQMSILPQIGREDLKAMINQPAKRVGLEIEDGLTDIIINDLLSAAKEYNTTQMTRTTFLPLLEFTLDQLWQKQNDVQEVKLASAAINDGLFSYGRLSRQDYADMQGVTGSLSRRATDTYKEFTTIEEQEQVKKIFEALVYVGDENQGGLYSRLRIARSDLIDSAGNSQVAERILNRFINKRLLISESGRSSGTVEIEIIHDALIYNWDTLSKWLSQDETFKRWQQEIQFRAQSWRNADKENHDAAIEKLLPPSELENVRYYSRDPIQNYPARFSPLVKQYIQASQARQTELAQKIKEDTEKANRATIRARLTIAASIIIGLITVVLVIISATQSVTRANQTLTPISQTLSFVNAKVQDGSAQVESLRLAAEANTILAQPNANAELAALLSIRALKSSYTAQADATLVQAFSNVFSRRLLTVERSGAIRNVAFSSDGLEVVTGSADGKVRLWNVNVSSPLKEFNAGISINSVAISPDTKFIAAAADDGVVHIWDRLSGSLLLTLRASDKNINSVTFSADGKLLLTGSSDNTARIWDAMTGAAKQVFNSHFGSVHSAAFSPDGAFIATASEDERVRLFDAKSGTLIRQMLNHTGAVFSVAFSTNGSRLVSSSADGTARVWDVKTGEQLAVYDNKAGAVNSAVYSHDSRYILTANGDSVATLWDTQNGSITRTYSGHMGSVLSVAFSPDDSLIITGSDDQQARVWNGPSLDDGYTLEGHTGQVKAVAISPDGHYAATGSADKTIRLWDMGSHSVLKTLTGHNETIFSLSFSPDSKYLLSGSGDNTAIMWDVATGKVVQTLSAHTGAVLSVAFSPDGKYALTGSSDQTARLWDLAAGTPIVIYEGHQRDVDSVTFSPDGSRILTGSWDQTARVWETKTGKLLFTLKGHTNSVSRALFSPDGNYILTASWDFSVRQWDAKTGKFLRVINTYSNFVNNIAFSQDGRYLLITNKNIGELWSFDPEHPLLVRTLTFHRDSVYGAALSNDGQWALTGSDDGTARLWNTDYKQFVSQVCRYLYRDFSASESATFGLADASQETCSSNLTVSTKIIATSGVEPMPLVTETPSVVTPLPNFDNRKIAPPPGSIRLGEFSVEPICTSKGDRPSLSDNSITGWACIKPDKQAYAIDIPDFDGRCREVYGGSTAFVMLDQRKDTLGYNWSCYDFVNPSTTPPASTEVSTK